MQEKRMKIVKITVTTLIACVLSAFVGAQEAQQETSMQAEIRAECSRVASDIAARYGNPEFAILVTNSESLGQSMADAIPIIEQGANLNDFYASNKEAIAEQEATIAENKNTIATQLGEIESNNIQLGKLDEQFLATMERLEQEQRKVAQYEEALASLNQRFVSVRDEMRSVFALVDNLAGSFDVDSSVAEAKSQPDVNVRESVASTPEQLSPKTDSVVTTYVLSCDTSPREIAVKALADRSVENYDAGIRPVF